MKGAVIRFFPVSEGVLGSRAVLSEVLSDQGDFSIDLDSGLYAVQVVGRYYDETSAAFSRDPLRMKGFVQVSNSKKAFINVFTHLAYDYIAAQLQEGVAFSVANGKAKSKVLALIQPITGAREVESAFGATGLTLADNPNGDDIAYLAYLSALITQTAKDHPKLTVQGLLSTLSEDVRAEAEIDPDTLEALLSSHANIDERAVNQNLGQIFNTNEVADIVSTVIDIDEFNPALAAPTYALVNSSTAYRFYFDGSYDDNGGVAGRAMITGGQYEIQISQSEFFSTLELTDTGITNSFEFFTTSFTGPGKRYVRVRKVKDNGQVGQWSGVLEFVI
ncbi:hypothetical protein GP5015_1741 [gamma proteobacterium HTCC5015]|nr:hypothetical protein GP5015_1741 [gamma proteobacterium HTCC5015]